MNNIKFAALLIVIFVILAGCIQPVQELGCCLKDNATSTTNPGCVLYNTTNPTARPLDLIGSTNGNCDDPSQNTSGLCNVTLGMMNITQGLVTREVPRTQLIPICTETQFQRCVSGNCMAMACGDFAYNPRVGPGFSSIDDATGNVPPQTDEGTEVANFYKARCKYLPMDERFKQIMKNAKAQVNVFRVGVGGSFDEYEQYKDYFPLSDKFCGRGSSDASIDRYQNYLATGGSESGVITYNPSDIGINCLNDIAYREPVSASPFGFSENTSPVHSLNLDIPDFNKTAPDARGYKTTYLATVNKENSTFGYLQDKRVDISKTLDTAFYKKHLYSSNVNQMYPASGNSVKAPFECNVESNNCYSGNCDTSQYIRGVMISGSVTPGFAPRDVPTDCIKAKDSTGKERVICAPTKTIIPDGTSPGVVSIVNTPVEYSSSHFEVNNNGHVDDVVFSDARAEVARLPALILGTDSPSPWLNINRDSDVSYNYDITTGISQNVPIPGIVGPGATANGPPAGGALFFGKLNNTPMVYLSSGGAGPDGREIINRDIVIGYALASSEAEFQQMALARECHLGPNDYRMIDVQDPDNWGSLADQFTPYINDRFQAMKTANSCGAYADMGDLIMSSMPWVLSYEKNNGNGGDDYRTRTYLTSPIAQVLKDRNILDQSMTTTQSETVCSMENGRIVPDSSETDWIPRPDSWRSRYNVYYSKKIFLIRYTPGSNMIGTYGGCAIDNETYLPKIKTYGWCQSCSQSTLAYQKINTTTPYQPEYIANPQEPSSANNRDSLCTNSPILVTLSRTCDRSGICTDNNVWLPSLTCENNKVADIKDFNGQLLANGTPRTVPNAATVKQRLGTYMKQGILPVLDLRDQNNWNLSYQNGSVSDMFGRTTPTYANYSKYDFEALFGNMGTLVVIVDNLNSSANATKISQIINRSALLKQKCYGCLSAIHINNPKNETEFGDIINSVLTDPIANFNIDMVTYDYDITSHDTQFSAVTDPIIRSQLIAGQIAEISRTALKTRRKSTMLVGLSVGSSGMWSNRSGYETLFNTIMGSENKFVNAGLIGIIYSPVRTNFTPSGSNGIVDISGGLGFANDKFCALEQGVERLSSDSEVSVFSKISAVNQVNCTRMSETELANYAATPGAPSPMICDNGVMCNLTVGLSERDAKCPDNTVVDIRSLGAIGGGGILTPTILHTCNLCNQTSGSYTCTYHYNNGTSRTTTGLINTLNSETQMEIIAGLPKPNKCCLADTNGNRYSYAQKTQQSSSSRPIVFPKDGSQNTDCGFGSTDSLAQLGTFCGVKLPVTNYKINCSVS